MPLYRRACTFNLSLHLLVMLALRPQISLTYSLFLWVKVNSSKTAEIKSFCYHKYVRAIENARFSMHCLILLFVSYITTWLFIFLLCTGGIKPYPGLLSVASSSGTSFSSDVSTDVFTHLNLNHNLSFVQYNVQSIVYKVDV